MSSKILLTINWRNEVIIHQDFINFCSDSRWENAKIIPVSVIGTARQGKSTFLNIFSYLTSEQQTLNIPNIFNAEYNSFGDSVTRGILFNSNLISVGYVKPFNELILEIILFQNLRNNYFILLLDSQGLQSYDLSNNDKMVASLALYLSSISIYNIKDFLENHHVQNLLVNYIYIIFFFELSDISKIVMDNINT